jgi:hypothetical protein
VPVAAVKDDVLVSKRLGPGGRVVTAVMRVGSRNVMRLTDGERSDFLERYAACLALWQFPYQILVWRERQDVAEFAARVADGQTAWRTKGRRDWADHLGQLMDWVERVKVQVNPQVPAYFIALPHAVSALLGQQYEKALHQLATRCETVRNGLAPLGLGCVRLDDRQLVEMVAAFYHPTLPMLRIPPRQRLRSLMVGRGVDDDFEEGGGR